MKQPTLRALTLAALVGMPGCFGTDLLAPIEPDEVRIRLTVTGGIAGVSYAFELDGESGEVRGLDCQSGCSFSRNDVLFHISNDQIALLAGRLEFSGVLESDGRDFGTECCDLFNYALEYESGDDSSRLEGASTRLPPGILREVLLVDGLHQGRAPVIVDPTTMPENWPRDGFELGAVTTSGAEISVEVSYGGGCEAHPMDLVAWGPWLESNPVQIEAFISHESNDDPCDAYLTETRRFDLLPLRDAYRQSYGAGAGPITVILRLADPESGMSTAVEVTIP